MLPNNIARCRKRARMSQEMLATAIGTTRNMLTKLESGDRKLSGEWLEKIGNALNIAPYLLIAPERLLAETQPEPAAHLLPEEHSLPSVAVLSQLLQIVVPLAPKTDRLSDGAARALAVALRHGLAILPDPAAIAPPPGDLRAAARATAVRFRETDAA